MTNFEHLNRFEAGMREKAFFELAYRYCDIDFMYSPKLMLLYDGYACQPDGITSDFSKSLEIKSLTSKNYRLATQASCLPHRFKRVYYKYFKSNPYLNELLLFFIDRENPSDFKFIKLFRPESYDFEIKRAHSDKEKIKGDFVILNLNTLTLDEAIEHLALLI